MDRRFILATLVAALPLLASAQVPLHGSTTSYYAPGLDLRLVDATQTVAGLRAGDFDFTPGDQLPQRAGNGFVHLGDITMRVRTPGGEWTDYASAVNRGPVVPLPAADAVLAAAELPGFPLRVVRSWEVARGALALRFRLENQGNGPLEVGALSIPMAFNNILTGRSLDEAHALSVFYDPYIGLDAGYVQVNKLSGQGPALLVVPVEGTPLEAWRPVLEDSTRRGTTFEGWQAWMPHSLAYAENEWSGAEPWNEPTSRLLKPGESATYGLRFLVADGIRDVQERLIADGQPVATGAPGYVVPMDTPAKLFLRAPSQVASLEVDPPGALTIAHKRTTLAGWQEYAVEGVRWGRARLAIIYQDGRKQTVHYKVIKPAAEVVADMGRFLFDHQWFDDPADPFGRGPSVISYDYTNRRQVTQDARAWIAGLGDEGGSGSWLAAAMKQLIQPAPAEIRKLERFVDETLWGGLQYADGPLKDGVRKSLFYYDPKEMPEGTYSDSINYGVWSAWSREHAESTGRSYNYPHVAALHWVMYRLARQAVEALGSGAAGEAGGAGAQAPRTGAASKSAGPLVTNHDWEWYLDRAFATSMAMVEQAPDYAQFGQMEGTIFLRILEDLQHEGRTELAAQLEAAMRARAEVWQALGYPFGSEMPWDSTGQEEVYAWTRYFGMDAKASVTLNAILAYMPLVPHWGYNGSARRYWDFWYAGHPGTSRLERQLHHYGSALNAIPVLTEFRDHPDDFHLLLVGHAGMMGALANVTQDGFAPSAFHSYPSTLAIDGYSGDYGPGFLGHVINTGAYLVEHPEFGWLAFGGRVTVGKDEVVLHPTDSGRMRVFIAPLGLYLTLDAGRFESVAIEPSVGTVRVRMTPGGGRLRVEMSPGFAAYTAELITKRDAYVVSGAEVVLKR